MELSAHLSFGSELVTQLLSLEFEISQRFYICGYLQENLFRIEECCDQPDITYPYKYTKASQFSGDKKGRKEKRPNVQREEKIC